MSNSHCVLSNYPLSADFRRKLEETKGAAPNYLSMPELRTLPPLKMVERLRDLGAQSLSIPVEDENTRVILPLLKILAGISDARTIEVVNPDLSSERITRWNSVQSALALLSASGAGYASLLSSRFELASLLKAPRIDVKGSGSNKALYLNANLWFGVKAGGSVGHVAGVANGLLKAGFGVDFASAGPNRMVSEQAGYIPLVPETFGMPFETNYYRFSRHVASTLDDLTRTRNYSFIYQRMSVCNYSGVLLSRRHRVPLILEYNGSEAWVAKNWGRPLRYHEEAEMAERACLRHAHAVVTISEPLRDELIQRGVEPHRIVCYPNCIDPEVFDPERISAQERRAVRQRYGIADDALVVEFIGTFGQWHGVDMLAQAIRKLAEQEPEWLRRYRVHFLIVGDGLKMPVVRQTLGSDACNPFYTLTGLVQQQEAPKYLASADVFVSPHVPNSDGSRFFGSPTKLFEYMAMSKAILASDLDQIGQVLGNSIRVSPERTDVPGDATGRLAVLFQPGNIDGLIAGLKMLVENERCRKELGQNARHEALARYTWEHHVRVILDKMSELALLRAPEAAA
ncbi:MAG: glycosyltransferase family 4 protein [Acidobacteriaceae bacterium]|nr:glycosyltransferase family 4 protein [Acidobacteriaceae bacterium]